MIITAVAATAADYSLLAVVFNFSIHLMYSIYYLLYGSSFKFIVALKIRSFVIFSIHVSKISHVSIFLVCTLYAFTSDFRNVQNSSLAFLLIMILLPPCTGKRAVGYGEEFSNNKSMESE